MTHFNKVAILALAIPTLGACQFYARSADDYASATKEVLAQKEDQIKSCYDDVLASDAKAPSGSSVKGAGLGPRSPVNTLPVVMASPTNNASTSGTCTATLPGVCPGT